MTAETDARIARLLHHRKAGLALGDPVVPPISLATTFHLPEAQGAAHYYGRSGQPTWDAVETQLAILENAETVAFPSGMAAITAALICSLKAGAKVMLPADGYYVTRLLGRDLLRVYGVEVVQVPTTQMVAEDFTGFQVIYIETPSNPGLDTVDIAALARKAHAAGALLIADNTTMTPLLQRPLDLGADLVVAADTKAPAGHSDALFGHVAGRDVNLMARIREWRRQSGSVPGPVRGLSCPSRAGDAGGPPDPHVRLGSGDRRTAGSASQGAGPALSRPAGRPLAQVGWRADGERRLPDRLRTGGRGGGRSLPCPLPADRAGHQLRRGPYRRRAPVALGGCGGRRLHPALGRGGAGGPCGRPSRRRWRGRGPNFFSKKFGKFLLKEFVPRAQSMSRIRAASA
jgi:hypothetical protein